MLNQQIGPYKIISELGEGGMAMVYLAEKGALGKQVALKVLKKEFIYNQHIRGRFLSEAKKMINLNHPNIVGVQDLIDENDIVAIELEYVEGKTLKQHLNDHGALPEDEIQRLFKQMLDAVGYIHEKGYIHRDIKPSNFMLTQSGIIKLTDFGIAKNADDANIDYTGTGTGMQMGTPKYMSPEQVRSSKDVDHRSDIYSLGVVLWEMVTGKVPYDIETESTFDVFRKIVDEPLKETHSRWDRVIEKCTNKNIEYRYQKVDEIVIQINDETNSGHPYEETDEVGIPAGANDTTDKNTNKKSLYLIYAIIIGVVIIGVQLFMKSTATNELHTKETFKILMEEGYVENIILWRNVGRVDFKVTNAGVQSIKQGDFSGSDFKTIERAFSNSGNAMGSASTKFSFEIASTESFIKEFEEINNMRKNEGFETVDYKVDEEHSYVGQISSFVVSLLIIFYFIRRGSKFRHKKSYTSKSLIVILFIIVGFVILNFLVDNYENNINSEDSKKLIEQEHKYPQLETDFEESWDTAYSEKNMNNAQKPHYFGELKDNRDGKVYNTVQFGDQVWMAENLAYEPSFGNFWAYSDDQSYVKKYGYLYDWETACKVCPDGWHLPSDTEWSSLMTSLGGRDDAGNKMKSKNGWLKNGNGSNSSGFSVLPSGYRYSDGTFSPIDSDGSYWSSTETNKEKAWSYDLSYSVEAVVRFGTNKGFGLSVRCLKGEKKSSVQLDTRFDLFYDKFVSDSVFQMTRLKFPLEGKNVYGYGENDVIYWTKDNWIKYGGVQNIYDIDKSRYTVEIDESESEVTHRYFVENSGFSIEYKYAKTKGKWFLVYLFIANV